MPEYKIIATLNADDDFHAKKLVEDMKLPFSNIVIETVAPEVTIYTDGGCEKAGGMGAWAYVVTKDDQLITKESGLEHETTNNRMEMMAVISALQKIEIGTAITVISDSKYVIDGITMWIKKWLRNGWKTSLGADVINQDLWITLHKLVRLHHVTFVHVKGHSGHHWNEFVDKMCTASMRSYVKMVSPTGSVL